MLLEISPPDSMLRGRGKARRYCLPRLEPCGAKNCPLMLRGKGVRSAAVNADISSSDIEGLEQ
jgi:hypothetical protein